MVCEIAVARSSLHPACQPQGAGGAGTKVAVG